jgi:NAD(P)-dependent dehydrogenase (short-subunit alcohol dehydrogenase family)
MASSFGAGGGCGGDWKDLLRAAGEGDLARVKYHIANGVDPNFQHPEYFTCPIFEAIRRPPSSSNSSGDARTTTTLATTTTNLEMVQFLVEQCNAVPDIVEELTDETPMEVALELGQFDVCDYLWNQLLLRDPNYYHNNVHSCSSYWPKHVLVTGGNRGLGKAMVELLLRKGHHVVFQCRPGVAAEQIQKELVQCTGNSNLDYILGELNSIASVVDLAQRIRDIHPTLNVIVHNAGLWPTELVHTVDGLELAFMVNYMAPYLLTRELQSLLEHNGTPHHPSRIVLVNAGIYVKGQADLSRTPYGHDFHPLFTYAHTKQCGVFFLLHQAKKVRRTTPLTPSTSSAVTITAVHPGVIRTGLGESASSSSSSNKGLISVVTSCLFQGLLKVLKRFWKAPQEGAMAPVWLAVSPDANGLHGMYFDEYHQPMKLHETVESLAIQEDWAQWTIDFNTAHRHNTVAAHQNKGNTRHTSRS